MKKIVITDEKIKTFLKEQGFEWNYYILDAKTSEYRRIKQEDLKTTTILDCMIKDLNKSNDNTYETQEIVVSNELFTIADYGDYSQPWKEFLEIINYRHMIKGLDILFDPYAAAMQIKTIINHLNTDASTLKSISPANFELFIEKLSIKVNDIRQNFHKIVVDEKVDMVSKINIRIAMDTIDYADDQLQAFRIYLNSKSKKSLNELHTQTIKNSAKYTDNMIKHM